MKWHEENLQNLYKSAGEINIPRRLPSTALQSAVATLPPALDDKITHILTVVGKVDIINIPSNNVESMNDDTFNLFKILMKGNAMQNGQNTNDNICIDAFKEWLLIASFKLCRDSDSPDKKKIIDTPNFLNNMFGRKKLLSAPSDGATLARDMESAIPKMKKFLSTKLVTFLMPPWLLTMELSPPLLLWIAGGNIESFDLPSIFVGERSDCICVTIGDSSGLVLKPLACVTSSSKYVSFM